MLFQSLPFLVLFVTTCILLSLLKGDGPRKVVILAASFVFYAWWDVRFLSLLFLSIGVNYAVSLAMAEAHQSGRRKGLLVFSVCFNLGLLIAFKYFNFFAGSLFALAGDQWHPLAILLPLGISFYTFEAMSYTIDIYRGDFRATRSLLNFSLYVAFFPRLVAGPIIRAKDFLPQLQARIRLNFDREGGLLFLKGLFKKVVIADGLANFASTVFGQPGDYPSVIIWAAALCFAVQIYCDFSGYTDMATGLARMMGFRFPANFNRPYFSATPSEFWQKWHISLSSWLRDYLYISLGGNRKGRWKTHRNLMITMLLGGIWHGASWNFVVWGGLHGLILVVYRVLRVDQRLEARNSVWLRAGAALVMQYFVLITWIAFRVGDFRNMLIAMKKFVFVDFNFGIQSIGLGQMQFFSTLAILALFWALHAWSKARGGLEVRLAGLRAPAFALALCGIYAALYLFWPTHEQPFIYFQF